MRIINIVGARPNFMKVAPLHRAMAADPGFEPVLVHTGQHYDEMLSAVFFKELELPPPDIFLGVGSDTHARQTAAVMQAVEPVFLARRPDLVLVVGDVNSTLACALVASKLHIPVAHVEAGLRSFDRRMPEEINRIVTDAVSDLLFVSEESGVANLQREGIPPEKIHLVGNLMIDSLEAHRAKAARSPILDTVVVQPKGYGVVTLHRPSNVDGRDALQRTLQALAAIQAELPIVFPIHPRTRGALAQFGLEDTLARMPNLRGIEPLGYLDFLQLVQHAAAVLTDSGGIQEETTYLGVPCITLRDTTERPATVTLGTNVLAPLDPAVLAGHLRRILRGQWKQGRIPPLWDGKAAARITAVLRSHAIPPRA